MIGRVLPQSRGRVAGGVPSGASAGYNGFTLTGVRNVEDDERGQRGAADAAGDGAGCEGRNPQSAGGTGVPDPRGDCANGHEAHGEGWPLNHV